MKPAHTWIIGAMLTVIIAITNVGIAKGASDSAHLTTQRWSFDGIFGKFDRTAVQRGLQVYLEVCGNCHSLARPSDYFVSPYAIAMEAATMNNGSLPPDLSLIYKARAGGADYIYGLLTGYEEEATEHTVAEGLYYNPYFPGGAIAMPKPLYGDDVEYADGTAASIEQESRDVATFLAWAAEPKLIARKKLGLKVLLFLFVLSALLFASKRKIWREIH